MSSTLFKGTPVDLLTMLAAREKRVMMQEELLANYPNCTLLSATMNIPGPVKTNEQLKAVFLTVIAAIRQQLPPEQQVTQIERDLTTGPEYYLVVRQTPIELKRQMITIEEQHEYGRLLDLDVVYLNQQKRGTLSRTALHYPPRSCFICSESAKSCGRQRRHSIEAMQQAISQLIEKGKMK
ncbi:citrate lyase holo-[acyl-carrier protein] synthase [Enterococcus sp. UD-01]|jgi:holo-ACP synthase|uniref:citrate lyase holo-[acyl-carrier protein] synthase n=1 Tax=Enterococcus sp. UD-01 TaxID=3373911 RepID=UPI003835C28A